MLGLVPTSTHYCNGINWYRSSKKHYY